MSGQDPVIRSDRDHALLGQISAVMLKLGRCAGSPTTTVKEDDGWLGRLVARVFLFKYPQVEFCLSDTFVGFGFAVAELRRIVFLPLC